MRFYRIYSGKRYLLCWAVIFLLFLFHNEVLIYKLNTYNWSSSTPQSTYCNNNRNDCTKILLVADPQIIGLYGELLHFLTPLSIYDSDKYLKTTYNYAYSFVDPDIVIFLGDLMDEGSSATDHEFYGYVRRVFNIFLHNSESNINTKHIWLPGDNDIGGEGPDRITPNKLKRFTHAFSQPDLIVHKNLTFFKINRFTEHIPVFKDTRQFFDTNKIFIGLSHLPLMFMPSMFVDKVLNKMSPHVLFTAHEHKSMVVSTDALLRNNRQITPVTATADAVFDYALGVDNMYEFIVPTCSYRMGTDQIGYGYAILEKNRLHYAVLWSPSRFYQIYSYLGLIATFIIFSCWYKCGCCRKF